MPDIRPQLEKEVVGPIFESVRRDGGRDPSLPAVVWNNRRERAYRRVLDALDSRRAPGIPGELRVWLESMVEDWSTKSFDDAFLPIQDFEIQCARDRELVIAQESGDPARVLEVRESEYRRKIVEPTRPSRTSLNC